MKRILVVSDIHIPSVMKDFPYEIIKDKARDIDLVFGLGDYEDHKGLDALYSFGREVYAVSGNTDDHILKSDLPEKIIVDIEGVNIGLIHGWGSRNGIREKLFSQFQNVDIICYGHAHFAYFKKLRGIYFLNPGSLSDKPASFAILEINNKKIKAEIIEI